MFSVQCALRRIGADSVITDNPEEIAAADKVIFPGVGEASTAMRYLTEHRLDELIKGLRQPVLGICIGLQLLCRSSEEGNTKCIGIFDVDVKRFDNKDKPELKIPQMGWNTIEVKPNQLIEPKLDGSYVYFVHSYYAPLSKYTIAVTDYIQPYSAALHRDNFFATQFHPEKSGSVGEIILKKFMEL